MTVIFNARLLDESKNFFGALILQNKKILRVLKGNFKTGEEVLKAAGIFSKNACEKTAAFQKGPLPKNAAAFKNCASLLKSGGAFCAARMRHEQGVQFFDAAGLTVTPAFIDMHAHFRDPGQTQKEDLQSGLAAAACGGFGTLVLMANTTPAISSLDAAKKICDEAAKKKMSRVFQTLSVTQNFLGSEISHLENLSKKITPVISEDGRDVQNAEVFFRAMQIAKKKDVIVSCHCEDADFAKEARKARENAISILQRFKLNLNDILEKKIQSQIPKAALFKIKKNLALANSLFALAEDVATFRNISLAKAAGARIHICHASTKNALDAVRNAKMQIQLESNSNLKNEFQKNSKTQIQVELNSNSKFDAKKKSLAKKKSKSQFQITCEVTPHHLALSQNGAGIFHFVNPPLRSNADRTAVIEALRDRTADVIATDHAPHTAADKAAGSPGFSGLETAYALCRTVLVCEENFSEERLSQLMSANPARILGLKKGVLQEGFDADLALVDTQEKWIVRASDFLSKGKNTPLEGKTLFGKVKALFVAGRLC